MHKLKVKDMDLESGGPLIAIINQEDATTLDLYTADRIRIKKGRKEIVAITDIAISNKLLKPGEIGLFEEGLIRLGVKNRETVSINIDKKPESLHVIKKKMDKESLNEKEIRKIVDDIVEGNLNQIELTYYVAANYINGMNDKETVALTKAMIDTGDRIEIKGKDKIVVDKHCIGGVAGNRTTTIVVPILAAAGLYVPKTSSRSITSPAGTADTMEVICNVTLPIEKIEKTIKKTNGCMVWGGAVNLAPADDTIINVEHPLSIDAEGQLLASILAKKGSVSAKYVLIDIPTGKEAKVKTLKKANHLANQFKKIGSKIGMKVICTLTDGNEPVGNGIGPGLEARDILWLFKGDKRAPQDLIEKSVNLAGLMLELTGKAKKGKGKEMAKELLDSGAASKKFMEIVKAQGARITKPEKIPLGKYKFNYVSKKTGKIKHISNKHIAKIARIAGCPKDKKAGLYLHKKKGDWVKKGDIIMTIYSDNSTRLKYAKATFEEINGIKL